MIIVLLTGSPRRAGNTNHLADQFAKGAEEAGHEVFRFDAAARQVKPCLGCNHCRMEGYANMSVKDAEAMTSHYRTIADYMGWEDVGSVIAPGIWTAGSIKGTQYAQKAYELGKSL